MDSCFNNKGQSRISTILPRLLTPRRLFCLCLSTGSSNFTVLVSIVWEIEAYPGDWAEKCLSVNFGLQAFVWCVNPQCLSLFRRLDGRILKQNNLSAKNILSAFVFQCIPRICQSLLCSCRYWRINGSVPYAERCLYNASLSAVEFSFIRKMYQPELSSFR